MGASFSRPVGLARLLVAGGLGLTTAHDVVGELVNERTVTINILTGDIERMTSDIRALGLEVSHRREKAA